jgi:hypothetical protein
VLTKIGKYFEGYWITAMLVLILLIVLGAVLSSCVPRATVVTFDPAVVKYASTPSSETIGSIQCVSSFDYTLTRCIDSELGKVIYVRGSSIVVSDIRK